MDLGKGDEKGDRIQRAFAKSVTATTPVPPRAPALRLYFAHQVLARRRLKQFAVNFLRLEAEGSSCRRKGVRERERTEDTARIPRAVRRTSTFFLRLRPTCSIAIFLAISSGQRRPHEPPFVLYFRRCGGECEKLANFYLKQEIEVPLSRGSEREDRPCDGTVVGAVISRKISNRGGTFDTSKLAS